MMDGDRLEALGVQPIRAELQKIDAMRTPHDLAVEAGRLSAIGFGGPFSGTLATDAYNESRLVVQLTQGGTLLPERDYYLNAGPQYAEIRAKYAAYLEQIFRLAGRAMAATDAADVIAIEARLADAQWSQVDSRNPAKTSNIVPIDRLGTEMPGFDWIAWAGPQGIDRVPSVMIAQPSFFKTFAALVPTTPIATWRAWLAARYITACAPYLSDAVADARFAFFGTALVGQEAPRTR
jgi:predicted metalloendopeptidase